MDAGTQAYTHARTHTHAHAYTHTHTHTRIHILGLSTNGIGITDTKGLHGYLLQKMKFGKIEHVMKLRQELGCRNFSWFLNNVAIHKRVPNTQDITHYGRVRGCVLFVHRCRRHYPCHPCHHFYLRSVLINQFGTWTNNHERTNEQINKLTDRRTVWEIVLIT